MEQEDVFECCKKLNPCEALCLLENVHLDLLLGKQVRSYKVGEEQFVIYQPTVSNVETAIEYYQKKCNLSKGLPSKRRAKVCFVFGDHVCPMCRSKKCGCR